VDGVERNVVDREDHRLILGSRGRVFSMALEGEVVPLWQVRARRKNGSKKGVRGILVIDISTFGDQNFDWVDAEGILTGWRHDPRLFQWQIRSMKGSKRPPESATSAERP